MLSEHLAVDRDEIAGGHGAAFFLDEGGIVAVGHKADILTVGLVRVDKAVLLRDTAHLVLAQSAERESDMAELFLRQRIEHIALILGGVERLFQQIFSVFFLDAGIMTRHDQITSQLPRTEQELVEFHIAVTVDTGIGRDAAAVAIDEFADDLLFKILGKVEHIIRDPDAVTYRARVLDLFERTAGLGIIIVFFIKQAHRTADPLTIAHQ